MSGPGPAQPPPQRRGQANSKARFPATGSNRRLGSWEPRPGDLVKLTKAASVQFGGDRATLFRIITIDPRPTYAGWVWLVGYTLDKQERAIERREVFVQTSGLIFVASGARSRPDG
jgi:hypothetical protein